jgi:hypothetical protein
MTGLSGCGQCLREPRKGDLAGGEDMSSQSRANHRAPDRADGHTWALHAFIMVSCTVPRNRKIGVDSFTDIWMPRYKHS